MNLIRAIASEHRKVKHTPFWAIHLCLPLFGALLFLLYYFLYQSTADMRKFKLILELTAAIFPLLISIMVSCSIALEEKTSHFQALLDTANRPVILLAKLFYLYCSGVFALFALFLLFLVGAKFLGLLSAVPMQPLLTAAAGIALCSFFLYLLHLFLSFRFGLGFSLFWGVFESLQCILYSNVAANGIVRYIPFAWSMNWLQDILNHQLYSHRAEWILSAVFSLLCLGMILFWFSRWEGQKPNT